MNPLEHDELQILKALAEMPMTASEIAECSGLSEVNVRFVLEGNGGQWGEA